MQKQQRTSYLQPFARLASRTCGGLCCSILSSTDAPRRLSLSRSAVRSSSVNVVMCTWRGVRQTCGSATCAARIRTAHQHHMVRTV